MPSTARLSDFTPDPSFERSKKLLGCWAWREMLTNPQACKKACAMEADRSEAPGGQDTHGLSLTGSGYLGDFSSLCYPRPQGVLLEMTSGDPPEGWGGASQSCSFPALLAELGEHQGKTPWCGSQTRQPVGVSSLQLQQVRGQWVSKMILPNS